MSYHFESSWERGNKAQNRIFRAGYSYSLKRAVQLFSCYVSASVCQAVLLERVNSLNFQRSASSEVMDSVMCPCELRQQQKAALLVQATFALDSILHRLKTKKSH